MLIPVGVVGNSDGRAMRVAFALLTTVVLGLDVAGLFGAGEALAQAGRLRVAQSREARAGTVFIHGATVYDQNHLWAYVWSHAAGSGNAGDIDSVARTMEQLYREHGYFLARVEARRDPRTGSVEYQVREGRISRIEIEGFPANVAARIEAYFSAALSEGPVQLAAFERAVALSGDLSGVSVRTELTDLDESGGAGLKVIGTAVRQRGSLTVDNPPRRLGKSGSAFLSQEFYSTFVGGDMLRFGLAGNKVFRHDSISGYGGVHYRAPIGSLGSYFEAFAGTSLARRDLSGTLQDSTQRGRNAIVVFGHPLLRDLHQFLFLLGEYDYSRGRSVSGFGSAVSQAQTLRASLVYGLVRDDGGTIKTGMTISAGHGKEDRLPGLRPISPNFWHLRAGFGWVHPFDQIMPGLALRTEVIGQATSSRVPEVEKFHLGDRERMRGYGFAEFEGGTGVTGTFELTKYIPTGLETITGVTPYAFFDTGYIHDRSLIAGKNDHLLSSLGAGMRLFVGSHVSVNGWLAMPLNRDSANRRPSPAGYLRVSAFW